MSRIGKKPVEIPDGVKVELKGRHVKVTGKLGSLEMDVNPLIKVGYDESAKVVNIINDEPKVRLNRQMHGTTRALIANMVAGVSKGYEKKFEIYGTGFNVAEQGGKLVLQVGFCNPAELLIPKGVKVSIEAKATRGDDVPAKFSISSIDKERLGQFASAIRKVRPPEPYKGKGIRYVGEQIRRKVGKAFATGAA
ncbi:MAG: 50S ribosomal protein L6 [Sedimentisphaerales bacterium]|nr:50S ribosomal protein L6 [Sedimentisphaerales bacterium]